VADQRLKQQRARQRCRGGEVESAPPDQWVIQAILPWLAGVRLLADLERKVAVDLMGVGRHRLPLHLVDARRQWLLGRAPHQGAFAFVDGALPLVPLLAGRVADDDGTECSLKLFVETQRDFTWGRLDSAADRRSRTNEMRVREGRHGAAQDDSGGCGHNGDCTVSWHMNLLRLSVSF